MYRIDTRFTALPAESQHTTAKQVLQTLEKLSTRTTLSSYEKGLIEELQSYFTKASQMPDASSQTPNPHVSILRFTAGNVASELQSSLKNLQNTRQVFLFRGQSDLSLAEMSLITSRLKEAFPDIEIFIDQEGGYVHRYIDFPSTAELSKILSDTYITERRNTFSDSEKAIFDEVFSVQKLYYFPSLGSL